MHERDSKRKIYVVLFSFWGLRPKTPTGALPMNPTGGRNPLNFASTSDFWRRHCLSLFSVVPCRPITSVPQIQLFSRSYCCTV